MRKSHLDSRIISFLELLFRSMSELIISTKTDK